MLGRTVVGQGFGDEDGAGAKSERQGGRPLAPKQKQRLSRARSEWEHGLREPARALADHDGGGRGQRLVLAQLRRRRLPADWLPPGLLRAGAPPCACCARVACACSVVIPSNDSIDGRRGCSPRVRVPVYPCHFRSMWSSVGSALCEYFELILLKVLLDRPVLVRRHVARARAAKGGGRRSCRAAWNLTSAARVAVVPGKHAVTTAFQSPAGPSFVSQRCFLTYELCVGLASLCDGFGDCLHPDSRSTCAVR